MSTELAVLVRDDEQNREYNEHKVNGRFFGNDTIIIYPWSWSFLTFMKIKNQNPLDISCWNRINVWLHSCHSHTHTLRRSWWYLTVDYRDDEINRQNILSLSRNTWKNNSNARWERTASSTELTRLFLTRYCSFRETLSLSHSLVYRSQRLELSEEWSVLINLNSWTKFFNGTIISISLSIMEQWNSI